MGIQTALIEREKSGKGMGDNFIITGTNIYVRFSSCKMVYEKTIPKQAGNNHPTSVPTGVFKTSNGAINLGVAGETIWKRFAEAVIKKNG